MAHITAKNPLKRIGEQVSKPFQGTAARQQKQVSELGGKILGKLSWSDKLEVIATTHDLIEQGKILQVAHDTLALSRVWLRAGSRHHWAENIEAFGGSVSSFRMNCLILRCKGNRGLLENILSGKYSGEKHGESADPIEGTLHERDVQHILIHADILEENIDFILSIVLEEDVEPRPIWFHQGIVLPQAGFTTPAGEVETSGIPIPG